jgi:hypothetical protein
MADHSKALVPLEAWAYAGTDIAVAGRHVDLGLLAEALLYYESLYVNVATQPQLAELIAWFVNQGAYSDFLGMVKDGTLQFYDYSFMSTAILKDGKYSLWNIQDEFQAQPGTFARRFLYHPSVRDVLPRSRDREKLYNAFAGRVIEAKADQFGPAIENARKDQEDPERNALIVQALVDEVYAVKKAGPPPKVAATVTRSATAGDQRITWNIDFRHLAGLLSPSAFHDAMPLTAGAVCNRLLWSAAGLNCDLYLSRPMSVLAGDKLYESTRALIKPKEVITELQDEVEFPDVRALVNGGGLRLHDIIHLRNKADRFRSWLQSEADRDRDAIFAYHSEVAREAGFRSLARHGLSIFGILGVGAAGGYLGALPRTLPKAPPLAQPLLARATLLISLPRSDPTGVQ